MNIDLNCDLGEGAGNDAALLPLITSANISCGAHAGDEADIRRTLRLAKDHGVAVGAHPGYADRENFGRRELDLDERILEESIASQVDVFTRWASDIGVRVRYFKPHGALYNQACRDGRLAMIIARIAEARSLPVLALPGSELERVCVKFIREGFADRRYREDGSLVPRSSPDAMIHDAAEAVAQCRKLIERGVQSLCVHGDSAEAVTFVRALRVEFTTAGVLMTAVV